MRRLQRCVEGLCRAGAFLAALFMALTVGLIVLEIAIRTFLGTSTMITAEYSGYFLVATVSLGLAYTLQPGEGAFYGPKIEFSLRDCLDRVWQLGTIQVDFSMPGRLGAQFVDVDGERRTPVMLHRAILGSLERFLGVLIEHYGGAFPTWLAPVQAVALNITDRQADYARTVERYLHEQGFRVEADLRNEKIGYKIREHTLQKVPYMLVLGDQELESGTVAVRHRDGTDLGSMGLEELVSRLQADIAGYGRRKEE